MKLLNPNGLNPQQYKAAHIVGIVLSSIAVVLGTICLVYSLMDTTAENSERIIAGAIIVFSLLNICTLLLNRKKKK